MAGQTIIKDDTVLDVRTGIDVSSLNISVPEGYLLSRITSGMTVKEIYLLSSVDESTTAMMIKKLVDEGVLFVKNGAAQRPQPRVQTKSKPDQYDGFVFNIAELKEEVDLSNDQKKEILYLHANFARMDYFKLLGVSYTASREEIKKSFFELSRKYHTDRFFNKKLGSFKVKMKDLYNQMASANRVLTDDTSKLDYLRQLVNADKIPKDIVAKLDLEDPEKKKLRLEKERRMRLAKRNPMMERVNKGRELYKSACEDIEAQSWLSAQNNLQLALTFDPHNENYKKKLADIEVNANKAVAAKIYERGVAMESYGQDGYLDLYRKATNLAPQEPQYAMRLASHYMEIKDWESAKPFLLRAVKARPKKIEYLMELSRALLNNYEKKEAVPYLKTVLEIDPQNQGAKKYLKIAKSWF